MASSTHLVPSDRRIRRFRPEKCSTYATHHEPLLHQRWCFGLFELIRIESRPIRICVLLKDERIKISPADTF